MSEAQLEVMDDLALEISACSDPAEKEELERTLKVCREITYGLAEGMIEAEEDEHGELKFRALA